MPVDNGLVAFLLVNACFLNTTYETHPMVNQTLKKKGCQQSLKTKKTAQNERKRNKPLLYMQLKRKPIVANYLQS